MTTVVAGWLCPPGRPQPGWLAIDDDGFIAEVGVDVPPHRPDIDLRDTLLAPGLVDLQVNGLATSDLATAANEGWCDVGAELLRRGVTSYLPTFMSTPLEQYPAMLERAAAARAAGDDDNPGAAILGVHLEGPFLGLAPGAHPRDAIRTADTDALTVLLDHVPDLVRMVTLAPEADPGCDAIRLLAARGVTVALGHSICTYDEAVAATDAGASVVTHLFNCTGPMHHREPGLAGAALDDERLTPTLIADLAHVHRAVLRVALMAKANVAVVSDTVATGAGSMMSKDGAVCLGDGTFAGATTMLDGALHNLVAIGVPVERAVEVTSTIPTRLLGLTDRGSLEAGRRADVLALDPSTLALRGVWRAGRNVSAG
ncbi:MAG TPA: amidohydrolase family protein [Acidimicrobiia bacterium]|nr:amidohydrolase family protein [Acidimicrobiia bacterium]